MTRPRRHRPSTPPRRTTALRASLLSLSLGLLFSLTVTARAADASPSAPTPTAAAVDADRFHALTSELRCVVCQNESLADSSAPIAMDIKREIRTRMAAGQTDAQITRFLVDRYGDFVTYRPPLGARTLLLWLGPLLLLAAGGWVVWRHQRQAGDARRTVP
jgi:cytochrome c-type biogenesis protein CcmH